MINNFFFKKLFSLSDKLCWINAVGNIVGTSSVLSQTNVFSLKNYEFLGGEHCYFKIEEKGVNIVIIIALNDLRFGQIFAKQLTNFLCV